MKRHMIKPHSTQVVRVGSAPQRTVLINQGLTVVNPITDSSTWRAVAVRPQLTVDGRMQRWCQQCCTFHPLAAFDGEKRCVNSPVVFHHLLMVCRNTPAITYSFRSYTAAGWVDHADECCCFLREGQHHAKVSRPLATTTSTYL